MENTLTGSNAPIGTIYSLLSIFLLCLEVAVFLFFIIRNHIRKKQFSKDNLWYIVPVFIIVFCLYLMGIIYTSKSTNETITAFDILDLLSDTIETFAGAVPTDKIKSLANSCGWYYAAAVIGAILACATTIISIISLLKARVSNYFKLKRIFNNGGVFVYGCSSSSKKYAKENNAVLLVEPKYKKELLSEGLTICVLRKEQKNSKLTHNFKKDKMYDFIIFSDENKLNSYELNWFVSILKGAKDSHFSLNIETSLDEMDIVNRQFIDIKDLKNVCIMTFNKHELIARKFIKEHPLSLDAPEDFYDKSNRTISSDKKINVILLGFGKVNYELLKLMIIQNQFVGLDKTKSKFVNHQVNYFVFDNNENHLCNNLITEIVHTKKIGQSIKTLPYEQICNLEQVKVKNVQSEETLSDIQKIVSDKNSFTHIIISIGEDFSNVDFSSFLYQKIKDYKNNFRIFVRTKENKFLKGSLGPITCFGLEKDVYTKEMLIDENIRETASALNDTYNQLVGIDQNKISSYNTLPSIEKYSNIYHAYSIYFKLGLLGVYYKTNKNIQGEERIITNLDQISDSFEKFNSDRTLDYYKKINVWNMLAFSEHSRWVATYVLKGFRPMPFEDIKKIEKDGQVRFIGKNINEREHCCLVDFYKLEEYHKELAKRYLSERGVNEPNKSASKDEKEKYQLQLDEEELRVETYKHDYLFINEGFKLLEKNGYTLYKKENLEAKKQ